MHVITSSSLLWHLSCVFPLIHEVDSGFCLLISTRIGEVLGWKEKKNPLLVGVCGGEALKTFTNLINRGKLGFLPLEISRLSIVSIEISDIISEGSRIDETISMKLDDLGRSKSGMVLNLGELKVLTSEAFSCNKMEKFVSKLSDLLKLHREKLWFIRSVPSNKTYLKLIERFLTNDKDWNLHLLPITSSSHGVYPKSSLFHLEGSSHPRQTSEYHLRTQ